MESTSFLEQPLDRDLYKPKKFSSLPKEPLRILITEAGSKIAFNLIYEICSGSVFGEDQEIIFHLINSRGSLSHKSISLELEGCGFSAYKDIVVSSNPAIAYCKVDIIIALATYEEIPGRNISNTFVYQLLKAKQVMKYACHHAKKDVKIIFAGPSTKALTVLLGVFPKINPKIPLENISCVTFLDAFISKAILASKLKTTTDKIKNVIILGRTFPDLHKATVRMYPENDTGAMEMEDIPVAEAVQDDFWLTTTFPVSIFRRVMDSDLLKYGKAVSQAISHHLKVLFSDSDNFGEIFSMGVLAKNLVYGVPPNMGFSFPVKTKNGLWQIIENLRLEPPTHLNILRTVFNHTQNFSGNAIIKLLSFMVDLEAAKTYNSRSTSRLSLDEFLDTRRYLTKYFVSPNEAETLKTCPRGKNRISVKSILWEDDTPALRRTQVAAKSSIRFLPGSNHKSSKPRRISFSQSGDEGLNSLLDEI